MPTFDYLCPNCETRYEEWATKYDTPTYCPECGTKGVKQLCATAFILNGPGFYSTGTFAKSKDGPKLDKDLLRLSDRDLNVELGLPPDMD